MTQTADVFCTSLAKSYILNMNSHVNDNDSSRPSSRECSPTELLNERRKFTSELMRIKQDMFARVDVVVKPSAEVSVSLLTHPMVESRVQSASSHLDEIYLKLCDDLDGFEAQSRKRLRIQREIETRLARCARYLGRLRANGDNKCDIYKFIDILEQSLEELYDDVAELVEEIRCERTTTRLRKMLGGWCFRRCR